MTSLERSARRTQWAVAVAGVAAAVAAIAYLAALSDHADGTPVVAPWPGSVAALALFVSGLCWLAWFRELFEPWEAAGATRFQGWRWWGWVIPGVDLVIPKMMVNDVWWLGDNPRERTPLPWTIQAWWVLWVASRAVNYRSWGDVTRPHDDADLVFGALYFALVALAAPFAVATIRLLTRRRTLAPALDETGANHQTLD